MVNESKTVEPYPEIDLRQTRHNAALEHGNWSEGAIRSAVRFQAKVAETGRVPNDFSEADFELAPVEHVLLRFTIVDGTSQRGQHVFVGEDHRIHAWARSVMKDELGKLVKRANDQATQSGFSRCSIHSANDRVLAYECRDSMAAAAFCERQIAVDMKLTAWIKNEMPATVFVKLPAP